MFSGATFVVKPPPPEELVLSRKKIYGTINKQIWITLTDMYMDICFNNGMLYGGCVRDYIIRTQAAKQYYSNMEKNGLNYTEANKYENYNNYSVDGMTHGDRLLLPNDLDIFCLFDDAENIIDVIKKVFNVCEIKVDNNYQDLFKDKLTKASIIHRKFELTIFENIKSVGRKILYSLLGKHFKKNTKIVIYVDLIILRKEFCKDDIFNAILLPPFGKPEFLCNMLCMKSKHLFSRLNRKNKPSDIIIEPLHINYINYFMNYDSSFNPLTEMTNNNDILKEIMNDIKNKIAKPVGGNISIYRCKKILSKGFVIDFNFLLSRICYKIREQLNEHETVNKFRLGKYIKYIEPEQQEDVKCCPICQEEFKEDDILVNWGCLCKVEYHRHCLIEFIKSEMQKEDFNEDFKCPNCRRITTTCLCMLANILIMDLYSEKIHKYDKLLKCKVHYTDQFEFTSIPRYMIENKESREMYLVRNERKKRELFIINLRSKMEPQEFESLFPEIVQEAHDMRHIPDPSSGWQVVSTDEETDDEE